MHCVGGSGDRQLFIGEGVVRLMSCQGNPPPLYSRCSHMTIKAYFDNRATRGSHNEGHSQAQLGASALPSRWGGGGGVFGLLMYRFIPDARTLERGCRSRGLPSVKEGNLILTAVQRQFGP